MMVVLALMALPVSSQEARFGVRGESLPVQRLTTFRAQPDEVEEAFVLRVGTFLERFSAAHGHEACAALVLVDDRLVARVSTNSSHVGCLVVTQAGDRYTGRSIHSHPRPGVVRLNLADNVLALLSLRVVLLTTTLPSGLPARLNSPRLVHPTLAFAIGQTPPLPPRMASSAAARRGNTDCSSEDRPPGQSGGAPRPPALDSSPRIV